jgi:hypothetical protein
VSVLDFPAPFAAGAGASAAAGTCAGKVDACLSSAEYQLPPAPPAAPACTSACMTRAVGFPAQAGRAGRDGGVTPQQWTSQGCLHWLHVSQQISAVEQGTAQQGFRAVTCNMQAQTTG